MKTVISFDFGTKSIGVAVGQQLIGVASSLNALKAINGIPNVQQISKIINTWHPDLILVGLPLNMDGTPQFFTKKAYQFARYLTNLFQIPVEMQDERLTTIEACSLLFKKHGYRALNKKKIDSQAAALILQDWFNNQK